MSKRRIDEKRLREIKKTMKQKNRLCECDNKDEEK